VLEMMVRSEKSSERVNSKVWRVRDGMTVVVMVVVRPDSGADEVGGTGFPWILPEGRGIIPGLALDCLPRPRHRGSSKPSVPVDVWDCIVWIMICSQLLGI
jgi:hypothetical protein